MRPAQKAPENVASSFSASSDLKSFNEAGAKSAGKRVDDYGYRLAFNPLQ